MKVRKVPARCRHLVSWAIRSPISLMATTSSNPNQTNSEPSTSAAAATSAGAPPRSIPGWERRGRSSGPLVQFLSRIGRFSPQLGRLAGVRARAHTRNSCVVPRRPGPHTPTPRCKANDWFSRPRGPQGFRKGFRSGCGLRDRVAGETLVALMWSVTAVPWHADQVGVRVGSRRVDPRRATRRDACSGSELGVQGPARPAASTRSRRSLNTPPLGCVMRHARRALVEQGSSRCRTHSGSGALELGGSMSAAAKIGLGVASGYLLGRTKKLRLAITIGSMLAGQRIATSPQGLLKQGSQLIDQNPELQKLQQQITGRLFDAMKAAAIATATSRLESVNSRLLESGSRDEAPPEESDEDEYDEDEYDEEGEDADDEPEDEADEEPEDEADEEPEDEADEEPEDEADEEPEDEADEEPEDEADEEPEDEADEEPEDEADEEPEDEADEEPEDEADEEPEDEASDEEPEDEASDEEPEEQAPERPRRRRARRSRRESTSAESAPASKSAAKKTSGAKKTAAKKSAPAKKTAAKKSAPAKKTAAKKSSPAKKTAAKKTRRPRRPPRRSQRRRRRLPRRRPRRRRRPLRRRPRRRRRPPRRRPPRPRRRPPRSLVPGGPPARAGRGADHHGKQWVSARHGQAQGRRAAGTEVRRRQGHEHGHRQARRSHRQVRGHRGRRSHRQGSREGR